MGVIAQGQPPGGHQTNEPSKELRELDEKTKHNGDGISTSAILQIIRRTLRHQMALKELSLSHRQISLTRRKKEPTQSRPPPKL